jgi:hypothetical protein
MSALDRRPSGDVFGRIVTGNDVELAALATLKRWARRYIDEVERQRGRTPGTLPEPRGYILASTFSKWPENQLPVCAVISPGWTGRPRRDGLGRALTTWSLAVGVLSHAIDQERTRTNGLDYIAAFRVLLAQQQSLGGLAQGIDCIDESYTVIPYSQSRSLFAAQAIFAVTVEDSFSYGRGPGGPWGPPPDPPDPIDPAEWPQADRHEVTVTADPSLTLVPEE